MTVAKIIEISAESARSFDDAVAQGIAQASKSVKDIRSAWVAEQKVLVSDGRITAYRVVMKVSFVLVD